MLYAIIAEDHADSLENRLSVRPQHLQRLQALQDQGRLIIAGPHPLATSDYPEKTGFSGSLIVAEFTTLEAAQRWADNDPYQAAQVYSKVIIKPFKQVFP